MPDWSYMEDFNFSSNVVYQNIESLKQQYPFLEIGSAGKSILGKDIPFVRIGRGPKEVFYSAAIHANEWITSLILLEFLHEYCDAIQNNSTIWGFSATRLFDSVSIYIMPIVNPDGVDLVTGALPPSSESYKQAQEIANNFPNIPFPDGWKANIRGVDLNLQFPAGWQNARQIKYSQSFNRPAPRDFVGYGPLTEPESLAIYNFTLRHNFKLILAYHSQGEVIFWQFQNYNPPNSLFIGNQFANVSGYSLEPTPFNSSFAGYKDWFIQNYNRPGYTIEVGLGTNPLPLTQFNKIYADNLGILVLGAVL